MTPVLLDRKGVAAAACRISISTINPFPVYRRALSPESRHPRGTTPVALGYARCGADRRGASTFLQRCEGDGHRHRGRPGAGRADDARGDPGEEGRDGRRGTVGPGRGDGGDAACRSRAICLQALRHRGAEARDRPCGELRGWGIFYISQSD